MTPQRGAIRLIDAGCERFVLKAHFPHFTPPVLFTYWTKPDLLQQWWSGDIEIVARLGGGFCLNWRETNRTITGSYTYFEQGERLAFVWGWQQIPDVPKRSIALGFRPSSKGGASLMLMAGLYGKSTDERKRRRDDMDCWAYFLTRLHTLESAH